MKIVDSINHHFQNYQIGELPRRIWFLYVLTFAMALLGCIFILINYLTHQYHGLSYLPSMKLVYFSPVIFGLNLLALKYIKELQFLGALTWCYTLFLLICTAAGLLANGIQYTPFHYIDFYLIQFDLFFHFDMPEILAFTYSHPLLYIVFHTAYRMIVVQLILICLVLPLFYNQGKNMVHFFASLLISFLAGTAFYYFFPTVAPAHFFNSPFFSTDEYNTFIKFYQIHNYLPVESSAGGMIAFPSFHVVWAVLFTHAYRQIKCLFYPFILINSLGILATMFLGWHYLADVLSGILLAIFSIYLAKRIFN